MNFETLKIIKAIESSLQEVPHLPPHQEGLIFKYLHLIQTLLKEVLELL